MYSSSKGIQVQFTVTIPAIEPQELQFDPNPKSGADRMLIGRGGFGVVYAGRYQGQAVAIKTLHVTTAKVVKSLYEEAAVMFRLASPYTVKLQGICSDENETSLVMERMMGGSLFHLLQDESQKMPWELRYRLAYEIAEGLWSLHRQEISHCDLKSLNVLLDEEKHAKITDFGFSKLRSQVTSMAPSSHKYSLGTLVYKSPELMKANSDLDEEEAEAVAVAKKGIPYTPYSDIYAYGMILWEIATRGLPFEGSSQRTIEKRIKNGNYEKIPVDCPPKFAALIKKCWAMKPGQRPRTDEIVAQTKEWYKATQFKEKDDFAVPRPIGNLSKKAVPYISIKDAKALKATQQLAKKTQKEQEKAEQRNKAAAEEDKEANTEGRIKAYSHFWKLAKTTPPDVSTFLQLVAEGEQDKAEVMLKANPRLGLAAGKVTDLSKRTFKNITGLQYALWALDWNMWMMLLKYIPREEAQLQAMALDESGTEHGKHFDFSQLLGAYKAYEKNYDAFYNMETHWCEQVGGAQLLLPAHAVNEHCRPDRAFYPLPDFKQEGLPRVREVNGKAGSDVYTYRYNGGQIGEKWALFRGAIAEASATHFVRSRYLFLKRRWRRDVSGVTALSEARLQQQQLLMRELLRNKPFLGKREHEKLAAEKAQVEADQKYAEKMQAEQTEKTAEQEKIQKAQAEEAKKEQEKAEKRNKAAVEENKEADTEGRFKVYSPLWKPVQAAPLEAAGGLFGLGLWKPAQPQDHTPPQVTKFLRLVAEGEQDKAETMLKADPTLALQSGRVTDLSKRTFRHITGFQYALWALDWNMWLMLLKYIPREEAQLQAMALDENGTEHGKHFDFSPLLGAYQTYEENYVAWSSEQRETHFCKQVGGGQLLLPTHVVNEYCRLDRAFYPLPDFKQEGLPRVRKVNGIARSDAYTQQYNGGSVGAKWALGRGEWWCGMTISARMLWRRRDNALRDRVAVTALSEARLQQQQFLMKELLRNKPLLLRKG